MYNRILIKIEYCFMRFPYDIYVYQLVIRKDYYG